MNCADCRFYKPPESEHAETGECRANPPAMFPTDGTPDMDGYWPRVRPVEWCGRYSKGRKLVPA